MQLCRIRAKSRDAIKHLEAGYKNLCAVVIMGYQATI
jgi:hypothetical protein